MKNMNMNNEKAKKNSIDTCCFIYVKICTNSYIFLLSLNQCINSYMFLLSLNSVHITIYQYIGIMLYKHLFNKP